MPSELRARVVRRTLLLLVTVSVIAAAAATMRIAADWRAASAPIDVAPVSMDTIGAQAAAEVDRAGGLGDQVNALDAQVTALDDALAQAGTRMVGDSGDAQKLEASLAATSARLQRLQAQLAAAKDRLAQLNRAAARQAALNAAAANAAPPAPASYEGEGEHDD